MCLANDGKLAGFHLKTCWNLIWNIETLSRHNRSYDRVGASTLCFAVLRLAGCWLRGTGIQQMLQQDGCLWKLLCALKDILAGSVLHLQWPVRDMGLPLQNQVACWWHCRECRHNIKLECELGPASWLWMAADGVTSWASAPVTWWPVSLSVPAGGCWICCMTRLPASEQAAPANSHALQVWYDEYVPTTVGRAEPHNLALIHPSQSRVLTIRENARTQVEHRTLHV